MKTRRRQLPALLAALMLVLMVVAWLALAPVQFGGRSVFVIVNGNSMEPTLHRGDLVIARAADTYQVGEIVVYRHPQIGPVIHRILSRENSQFTFKGDHNGWTDSYHPAQSELIGALWLHVPSAGRAVDWLRKPLGMALLVFVMGIVLMTTATSDQDRRRARLLRYAEELRAAGASSRSHAKLRPERLATGKHPPLDFPSNGVQELVLFGLASIAFVALLLLAAALARPLERSATDEIAYTQSGTFGYTASAPAGVYDAGALRAGEPIFRKLVSQVEFGFSYRLASDQPHQAGGTYRLVAEVGASDGWKRTIELQPATPFKGDRFVARGRLDLAAAEALIDEMERRTSVEHQQYTVAIVPQVTLAGALAGQELHDTFAPQLVFRADDLELQVVRDDLHGTDPLAPTQAGALKRQRSEPNTIGLLGLSLGVVPARWLALALALLATAGAVVIGRRLALSKLGDEPERIRVRYGPLLVAVRDSELAIDDRVVEVASFDDLARLAERDERMILYERSGTVHHYVVQIAGVNYHYRAVQVGGARALAAQERRP